MSAVFGLLHPDASVDEVEHHLRQMRAALPPKAEVTLTVRVPVPEAEREWWGHAMIKTTMRAAW